MFQTLFSSKLKTRLLLLTITTFVVACDSKSNILKEPIASEPISAAVIATENSSVAKAAQTNASMPLVGSDKDAHGCIPSAGYIWCTKESTCVKPWDYAAGVAIPNTLEAVNSYCGNN
jgi:hypothetical protein